MDHAVLHDPVLTRFRVALSEIYGERVERAVLFGSRARGDFTPESDYDVAVFLRDYTTRWDEMWTLAEITTDILRDTGALISAKPFRAGDDRDTRPLMREIARDGLDL
jgi:predicted nucleotidyltransferase